MRLCATYLSLPNKHTQTMSRALPEVPTLHESSASASILPQPTTALSLPQTHGNTQLSAQLSDDAWSGGSSDSQRTGEDDVQHIHQPLPAHASPQHRASLHVTTDVSPLPSPPPAVTQPLQRVSPQQSPRQLHIASINNVRRLRAGSASRKPPQPRTNATCPRASTSNQPPNPKAPTQGSRRSSRQRQPRPPSDDSPEPVPRKKRSKTAKPKRPSPPVESSQFGASPPWAARTEAARHYRHHRGWGDGGRLL